MPLDPQLRSMMLARMTPDTDEADDPTSDSMPPLRGTFDEAPDPAGAVSNAYQPTTPQGANPQSANRQQLYKMLVNRRLQAQQNDDQYISQRKGLIDLQDKNAENQNTSSFLNALNRSASQIGTLGGSKASTAAPAEQAQEMRANNQENEKQMSEDLGRTEKVGENRLSGQDKAISSYENRLMQDDTKRVALAQVDAQNKATDAFRDGQLGNNKDRTSQMLAIALARIAAGQDARTAAAGAKSEADVKKDRLAFQSNIDAAKGRAGNLGKAQDKLNQAHYIEAITGSADTATAEQLDQIPGNQVYEVAMGLARMLGGGVPAQQEIEHLVPQSYRGNVQGFLSKLENEPKPAMQGAFVRNLLDSVRRERNTAFKNMKDAYGLAIQAHSDLRHSDPQHFYSMLRSVGVHPEVVDRYLDDPNSMQLGDYNASGAAPAPTAGGAAAPQQGAPPAAPPKAGPSKPIPVSGHGDLP